jgi:Ca-activated chloride channel family protein
VRELGFHFAQPAWFWGLLALIPVAIWLWRSAQRASHGPIQRYADGHLLPHLTGSRALKATERWGRFLIWSLLWGMLLVAMAGPRWDYTDVRLFHPGDSLLILLDISRSMEANDVAPSRLARARQEIQDLIEQNRRLRLGLIAFSSVPHVMSPITEDTQTIRNALPALATDLSRLQGSRLHGALDRAEILLKGLPGDSARSLLLISDGDFDEPDLVGRVKKLAEEQSIRFHALGVGTPEGATVPAPRGGSLLDRSGQPVRSRLNEEKLKELAGAGGGVYQTAVFRDSDTEAILDASVLDRTPPEETDERTRVWNERFYLPVIAVAALLLPAFRRDGARRR